MAGILDDSFAHALAKHNDPIFWGGARTRLKICVYIYVHTSVYIYIVHVDSQGFGANYYSLQGDCFLSIFKKGHVIR